MTPEQKSLTRSAIEQLKTVSVAKTEPHDAQSLSEHLTRNNIHEGEVDLAELSITGFSRDGLAAVSALAKSYRPIDSPWSRQSSNATLAKVIAREIIRLWKRRDPACLSESDYDELETAIVDWFAAQGRTLLHAVPCIISPYQASSISVGPVTFVHIRDFPSERFGVERKQFWQELTSDSPTSKQNCLGFESFIRLVKERYAQWVALVEIPGRAKDDSIATADIATDIALAALQISNPDFDLRNITRATARTKPVWRVDVWTEDGDLSQHISNCEPARTIPSKIFEYFISVSAPKLAVIGKRLTAFFGGTSPVPSLDEAWCNAAYWYHEALAESLDTIAVAKLETAIEVLVRAENMTGSKERILRSINAIFDLSEDDSLGPITVRQFALAITTARSRVVHGTWPTLHTDLPGYKGQPPVSFGDLETLARHLLTAFAKQIDEYVLAGETNDSVDALLAWIGARRLGRQS